jgi:aminoglycoside 2''-phosphotransferase
MTALQMDPMIQRRIDQVKQIFPFKISTLSIYDNGEDFLVLEINQDWMFRFPRNNAAHKVLRVEQQFLPQFEVISPIPIPKIRYAGEDFSGYPKIEGSLLSPKLFESLPDRVRAVIARQVGGFLSKLHTFPLEKALAMGFSEGWDGWRQNAYQRFQANAGPLLSRTARKNVNKLFDRFFDLNWQRVVIHGDFYPTDHVFFDEESLQLCGVIDFGDLTIEDAATDFQSIYEDYGEIFLHDVLTNYSCSVDQIFLERIKVRIEARPLFEASYALEYGLEGRFKRRIAEIEVNFG